MEAICCHGNQSSDPSLLTCDMNIQFTWSGNLWAKEFVCDTGHMTKMTAMRWVLWHIIVNNK